MTSWPELMALHFRQEILTTPLTSAAAQTACLVDGGICVAPALSWHCRTTVTINRSPLDGPILSLIARSLSLPLPPALRVLKWCWGKLKGVQSMLFYKQIQVKISGLKDETFPLYAIYSLVQYSSVSIFCQFIDSH